MHALDLMTTKLLRKFFFPKNWKPFNFLGILLACDDVTHAVIGQSLNSGFWFYGSTSENLCWHHSLIHIGVQFLTEGNKHLFCRQKVVNMWLWFVCRRIVFYGINFSWNALERRSRKDNNNGKKGNE